jgi:hypothetical protein
MSHHCLYKDGFNTVFDLHDQSILIAADIKNSAFANPVGMRIYLPNIRKISPLGPSAGPVPGLKRDGGVRMLLPECSERFLGDHIHFSMLSK